MRWMNSSSLDTAFNTEVGEWPETYGCEAGWRQRQHIKDRRERHPD